jgi:hypothetical protein
MGLTREQARWNFDSGYCRTVTSALARRPSYGEEGSMAEGDARREHSKSTIVAVGIAGVSLLLTWWASTAPVTCDLVNTCYPELPGAAAIVGAVTLVAAALTLIVVNLTARHSRTSRVLAVVVIVLSLAIPIITYLTSNFTTPWV